MEIHRRKLMYTSTPYSTRSDLFLLLYAEVSCLVVHVSAYSGSIFFFFFLCFFFYSRDLKHAYDSAQAAFADPPIMKDAAHNSIRAICINVSQLN